eukprot:scaffold250593_cov32-Tisochrysis_lutea.AAC.2
MCGKGREYHHLAGNSLAIGCVYLVTVQGMPSVERSLIASASPVAFEGCVTIESLLKQGQFNYLYGLGCICFDRGTMPNTKPLGGPTCHHENLRHEMEMVQLAPPFPLSSLPDDRWEFS